MHIVLVNIMILLYIFFSILENLLTDSSCCCASNFLVLCSKEIKFSRKPVKLGNFKI